MRRRSRCTSRLVRHAANARRISLGGAGPTQLGRLVAVASAGAIAILYNLASAVAAAAIARRISFGKHGGFTFGSQSTLDLVLQLLHDLGMRQVGANNGDRTAINVREGRPRGSRHASSTRFWSLGRGANVVNLHLCNTCASGFCRSIFRDATQ